MTRASFYEPRHQRRRVRCSRCSKPCARTRRSSSPRRASATTRWRGWRATAPTKPVLAAEGLFGPAQAEWLDRVRDDLESYRGALTWLMERGRPAEAANIAWGLMYFWVIRGHAVEGLQWYEQVLNLPALPPVPESRALVGAAMMWYTLGELARARTGLTRALELAHGAADAEMIAQAEHLLGHVEHALGNATAARTRLSRSVEGFRALAIPWGVGNSLNGLAKVALLNGDATNAERLLDEACIGASALGSVVPGAGVVPSRDAGGAAWEPR